jgi:Uma2 family endonuclease
MTLIQSREPEIFPTEWNGQVLLDVSGTELSVTDEQFEQLCFANPDLRLELTSTGKLIVMPPTFPITGERNADLIVQVGIWNRRTKLGKLFDSSTGYNFRELAGGRPSPDVSWVQNARIEGIELNKFLTVVPDFAIELRSSSDRLSGVQSKMLEYQALGVRLGWLINPQDKQVEIYRVGKEVEVLNAPTEISGEDVLPEFMLDLTTIW